MLLPGPGRCQAKSTVFQDSNHMMTGGGIQNGLMYFRMASYRSSTWRITCAALGEHRGAVGRARRERQRLGAQVGADKTIGRVRIRRPDRRVLGPLRLMVLAEERRSPPARLR
jgi:hypothetical protein